MIPILPVPPSKPSSPASFSSSQPPSQSKRSKACTNCRKSKIKCIKSNLNDDICNRCKLQGLQCIYEFKIPSFKVAKIGGEHGNHKIANVSSPNKTPSNKKNDNSNRLLISNKSTTIPISQQPLMTLNNWENSVEDRLNGFGSQLSTILSLLQHKQGPPNNQEPIQQGLHQQELNQQKSSQNQSTIQSHPSKKRHIEEFPQLQHDKRQKAELAIIPNEDPTTTLYKILSLEKVSDLFTFFNNNISPQLFGFDISKYSIKQIWENCPLLIATISCISSIHYPDSSINELSPLLESIIYRLSSNILFNLPKNEIDSFNSIIALIFCGFWFKNNQMFTGLAIQLSKHINLLHNKSSIFSKRDRLKLWYLLYILDGQQSLVFNRQSLINSREINLSKDKKILEAEDKEDHVNKNVKENENHNISIGSNIRLISQVEYHNAINSIFDSSSFNGFDLLKPSSFGLPFKTNLELDKWMVQWTVLLNPYNTNKSISIWSSKSTLIYYNFAKIFINSKSFRNFHNLNLNLKLPNFNEIENDFENLDNENLDLDESAPIHVEDFDSDEEDEFMKELSPTESSKISAQLTLSSAETVLNIVLQDKDILNVLKYVPIHIHIMLYYSALILLKPIYHSNDFNKSLNSIKLVKLLKTSILKNLPTDREFSNNLIVGLTNLINDKINQLKSELGNDQKLLNQLNKVINENNEIAENQKNQDFKISAWPGFDAGHPSKALHKANK